MSHSKEDTYLSTIPVQGYFIHYVDSEDQELCGRAPIIAFVLTRVECHGKTGRWIAWVSPMTHDRVYVSEDSQDYFIEST